MKTIMKVGKKLPNSIKSRLFQAYLKRYVKKLKAQGKRYVKTKIYKNLLEEAFVLLYLGIHLLFSIPYAHPLYA